MATSSPMACFPNGGFSITSLPTVLQAPLLLDIWDPTSHAKSCQGGFFHSLVNTFHFYIYNCAWKIIVSVYTKGCKDVGCKLDRTTATNFRTFYTFFTYFLKRSYFLLTLFSEIKLELSSAAVHRSSSVWEARLWRVQSLSWEALCSDLSWQGQGPSLPTSLQEADWLCSQGQGSVLHQWLEGQQGDRGWVVFLWRNFLQSDWDLSTGIVQSL